MSTLDYYQNHAMEFVQGTVNADMGDHYEHFLSHLRKPARILDLGCGSGRDSKHFIEKGYAVVAVDGSPEVCRLAEGIIGQPVQCIRFEDLDFHEEFDGVWACASLLHVSKEEMPGIMLKVAAALKTGGILYASFKYGSTEGYVGERLFNYYTEDDVPLLLDRTPFQPLDIWITNDVRPGRGSEKWANFIAVKA